MGRKRENKSVSPLANVLQSRSRDLGISSASLLTVGVAAAALAGGHIGPHAGAGLFVKVQPTGTAHLQLLAVDAAVEHVADRRVRMAEEPVLARTVVGSTLGWFCCRLLLVIEDIDTKQADKSLPQLAFVGEEGSVPHSATTLTQLEPIATVDVEGLVALVDQLDRRIEDEPVRAELLGRFALVAHVVLVALHRILELSPVLGTLELGILEMTQKNRAGK